MRYELKILFLVFIIFFNMICFVEMLIVFISNELKCVVILFNSLNLNKVIKILIVDGDYYGLFNFKIIWFNVYISLVFGICENVVLYGNGMKK